MRPHPILTERYARPEAKPGYVDQLFNRGARHYDAVVDWGFLRTGAGYRRWVQQHHGLQPGHRVLDVACGTGLVAVEAARILGSAANITCLDPSEGMLTVARGKLAATFVQARAEAMPLPDQAFDFLTMGYALRHVSDLETTFREYRRVLRPGGRILILEVTKPSGRLTAFLFKLYFGHVYPALTRFLTRSRDAGDMMRYYWETMDACVPPAAVLDALRAAGLTDVRRHTRLGLFSEYVATRP